MLSVVIIIHLMLVITLIGVVLLQKSEGGGLISSTSGFMTGRGTANMLSRTTALLAAGFFVTSLALSWLANYEHRPTSIVSPGGASTAPPPAVPGAPLGKGGGGVLKELGGGPAAPAKPAAPVAPTPPAGPEVPESK